MPNILPLVVPSQLTVYSTSYDIDIAIGTASVLNVQCMLPGSRTQRVRTTKITDIFRHNKNILNMMCTIF